MGEAGYTTKAFIRKNTEDLRNKLVSFGFSVCPCCTFSGSVWLCNCIENNHLYIHGIGYTDEDLGITTTDQALDMFLTKSSKNYIDCGEDEELFIDLISLRSDSDLNQLFTDGISYLRCECTTCMFNQGSTSKNWRKCTINEILKYHGKNT